MKNQKSQKQWIKCETCFQLVYTAGPGTGHHKCPEAMRAKHEAELDMMVEDLMTSWDEDVEDFWGSRDVQFWSYLLEQRKKI